MSEENKKCSSVLPSISQEGLDNLPFGVYIIKKGGVVEFFNKEMAKISGVKNPKEVEGQNILEIPNYKKYGLDKYVKQGLEGKPFKLENIKYVSYIGKKRTYRSYYGIPIKNEKGDTIKLFCIVEDVTEKKENQKKIQDNLEEKEALLKELHHRVKNNMQIIYSLLNTQVSKIKDEEALEIIKESKNQIKSMLLIHESLYQSNNLAGINLKEYIEDLADNLFVAYGTDRDLVHYDIKINSAELNIEKAIPCALIINELISNCLKHAFPGKRKGNIEIKLSSVGRGYELEICDDGIGLDCEPNLEDIKSIGLDLVSTLTKQLGGILDIISSGGTKIKISFPKF
ncbi:hypothetical protein A2331_03545 [Candidatus Falkowbacteria bacterium RIFOXYB2_FULL_34_18]|uniref:PAC domain-containing protein n=1 Tax=Candidatus Falkowbacteria bacterium RIFOXYD2_FULL_34_120 TaxID=1798007 RepID=A0A1F5TSE8_9BACT|nr:MAG: hypothetical protein A2331_03545 [Candidatus Falkowbacteria bacterium RIFOXYB2_FULL_34_18]OGF30104.1 MAG: hypothetical protein A2500_04905 [Candidatus Falkowbacteria bacterium RIFOXYC12_FULL_34_55]OGF37562.1 MAG: hypothetical protein A2466_01940 [Candidatus Falkowbacteria bacterium RIFOXYC2_FULL_34_220]OGF39318.1 MAG: hypothetical protein A2515_02355 [Candidatus Falkowbacteria bacterium RIFOXYD12_FULL_34_57]OGF41823.1 MAG: hypothetical protein A2531_05340 [Candidatus Falkowbacteria bact